MKKNSSALIFGTEVYQKYVKDIKKLKVLTHDETCVLFEKYNSEKVTKKEKEIIRNQIIETNLKFVISIAKNYQNQGMDIMDLISEGNMGLYKAIDKFDIKSNYRFISYAVWWIRQAILEAINKKSRTIQVPSNVLIENLRDKQKERQFVFENVVDDNEKILDFEFCGEIPSCVSLEISLNNDGTTLMDLIEDPNTCSPEAFMYTNDENKKNLKTLFSCLSERERIIISDHYGLENGHEITLEEISDKLGCTKERVRQLKANAIKKLRNNSYNILNDYY